jgi:hypothetical protein
MYIIPFKITRLAFSVSMIRLAWSDRLCISISILVPMSIVYVPCIGRDHPIISLSYYEASGRD